MTQEQRQIDEALASQAAAWYVAQRQGELDGAAREQFVEWLRASPLHVAEYLAISGIGRDVPNAVRRVSLSHAESLDTTGFATEVAFPAPLRRDAVTMPAAAAASVPRRPSRQRMAGLAAAVAIVGVAAVAWLNLRGGGQQFITGHGEQRTWQLQDMSLLRLNSASAVRVRFDAARREITLLRGQAYFDVAKDPARPFEVRTRSATLTALGTAFDVYEQGAATVVTVVEGRVAVQPAAGGAGSRRAANVARPPPVELSAGDQMRIHPDRTSAIARANIPRATAWVRQEIAFHREPIAAVVAEFNRYNRTQLTVRDERVAAIPVSGVFHSYDVQSFVDFLDQLPNVHVTSAAGHAVVTYEP